MKSRDLTLTWTIFICPVNCIFVSEGIILHENVADKQKHVENVCKSLVEEMASLKDICQDLFAVIWITASKYLSTKGLILEVFPKEKDIEFNPVFFNPDSFQTCSENQFREDYLGRTAYNFMLSFRATIERLQKR